jgi:alpha-D-ribose 1-methylphosphonate 5-triphosphate diphosphatase
MSERLLLTHAEVVLPDGVARNLAVLIEDGVIAAIDPSHTGPAKVVDLAGRILMPGLIDLHCDALEKEVEPRTNVCFPLDFACAQVDKRNAAAGVTTVFHALAFAHQEFGVRNNAFAARIAQAIHAWQPHALVENRVHARCEVTDPTGPGIITELIDNHIIHLLSFMDHTPGQGQYQDVASYRRYLAGNYQRSESEIDDLLNQKAMNLDGTAERVTGLARKARAQGIPLASHDDDSPARVATMAELGVSITEFPVNLETARAARKLGIATLVGAPNVLRGASQSGALRALDAVLAGVADCLCGDYSAAALLPSVFKLVELSGCPLHEMVALVSANPARAVGLADRGEIAVGKRADLISVRHLGGLPQVERVWVRGHAAFRATAQAFCATV